MNRRRFVRQASMAAGAVLLARYGAAAAPDASFPEVRTPPGARKFTSQSVEALIAEIQGNIGNKELAWMFGNCFPNTLDTTVDFSMIDGRPDTYVITGDIDAMWLRDSSAQVWPYLPLCRNDEPLRQLVAGVINRQTTCILHDPYANAFYKDERRVSEWKDDDTAMKPGVHERKWEVDSLCYPIRLAHGYWKATGDISPFDSRWREAMHAIVATFTEQQRLAGRGPYSFMRRTEYGTDTLPLGGYGYPARSSGMIYSMFRPSDDATVFPLLVPSNLFAIASLSQLAGLYEAVAGRDGFLKQVKDLRDSVTNAAAQLAVAYHEDFGRIYAYETNGYGSHNLMDDANVPSLLSLPYLNPDFAADPVYVSTRRFVLSDRNPFFFKGKAAEGVGGPHAGMDRIWPLSIIMRGLTSAEGSEIRLCLGMLQQCHAGTGFIHESFSKDDAGDYSRKWFAWANTLFGELIWKVYRERPRLLNA